MRATRAHRATRRDRARSSSPSAAACRSASRDVATVGVGPRAAHRQRQRERRGGRGRHRAHADRREQPHGRGAPSTRKMARGATRRCRPTSARRRCSTARSWSTRRSAPSRRTWSRARSWSSSCCSLLLGNVRAALITALAIPLSMLLTADRHGADAHQRQPDEPRRDRLRPDRRRRGHHRRELPAAARRAAARARAARSTVAERLAAVLDASRAGARGHRLRRGDHHHRLRADPLAHRRRGEDVPPDGADRDLRAGRGVRAVAHVRAGDGRDLRARPRPREARTAFVALAKRAYEPALRWALALARSRSSAARSLLFVGSLAALHAARAGVRADARRARHRWCRRCRIPSTGARRSRPTMQLDVERALPRASRGGVRVLADRHRRDGDRPDAAERLRHVHHPEAARASGRTRATPRRTCARSIETALAALPGNHYEFTQPIQMRFNELIAGVRGDVAVKVYGDDFERDAAGGRRGSPRRSRAIPGAADVQVEQIAACRC